MLWFMVVDNSVQFFQSLFNELYIAVPIELPPFLRLLIAYDSCQLISASPSCLVVSKNFLPEPGALFSLLLLLSWSLSSLIMCVWSRTFLHCIRMSLSTFCHLCSVPCRLGFRRHTTWFYQFSCLNCRISIRSVSWLSRHLLLLRRIWTLMGYTWMLRRYSVY